MPQKTVGFPSRNYRRQWEVKKGCRAFLFVPSFPVDAFEVSHEKPLELQMLPWVSVGFAFTVGMYRISTRYGIGLYAKGIRCLYSRKPRSDDGIHIRTAMSCPLVERPTGTPVGPRGKLRRSSRGTPRYTMGSRRIIRASRCNCWDYSRYTAGSLVTSNGFLRESYEFPLVSTKNHPTTSKPG